MMLLKHNVTETAHDDHRMRMAVDTHRIWYACCALAALCVIALTSCTSLQQDVVSAVEPAEQSEDIHFIESKLAVIDAEEFVSSADFSRTEALADVMADVEQAVAVPGNVQAVQARLYALKGRILLLDGKKSKARDCYDQSVAAFKGDAQGLVLGSRLGLEPDFSSVSNVSSEKAILTLEQALVHFTAGSYLESSAQFDTAFLSLPSYYRAAYGKVRDRAWELRNVKPGAKNGKHDNLLYLPQITVGQMMLITQNTSSVLFNYTAGKTLSETELFKKLAGAGLVTAASAPLSADGVVGREDIVSRIICARFLWNLYASRKGSAGAGVNRYSTVYRTAGEASPVPDIPLSSPDFDAVLGTVENELMSLPDGIHFEGDKTVSAAEFSTYLQKIE